MSAPEKNPEVDQDHGKPKAHPLLEPGDYTQYLLRTRNEVLFVLRSLMTDANHITVHFNEGRDFFLTTLIQLDEEGLTLDLGANAETNQRALAAERLFCVTSHDKIRIQFQVRRLKEVMYEDRPAFRAALPDAVLRLQRREYFRLTTPIAHPIKCRIPVKTEGGLSSIVLDANVVDISGGGLAMMAPPENLIFSAGDIFENCRIELPDVGIVLTSLEVRNVFEITLRNGARVTRAGCQFTNLPGTMLTLVQRYIIKVERERKARESGMA
jgi:c-di-GMP-binding flagellar brake protein YcgR